MCCLGMWGALAGMSANGLTVHEANLEEKQIGFSGTLLSHIQPLRYIYRLQGIYSEPACGKLYLSIHMR